MEYLVVVDTESQFGRYLLVMQGSVGGATDVMKCGLTLHPLIVCSDLDWKTAPGFLRATHLRDPLSQNKQPIEMFVPTGCVLFVIPRDAFAKETDSVPKQQVH